LKNLTMNHMVREHKDQRNCTAEGYDRTTSVCAVFVDSVDHVWSIKLIGNMNMHAGSYVKKRTRVEHVCSIIWPYTVDIDESYSELRARYRKGKWSLDCVPTWREPWKLFLDDNYDYEVLEVGGVGWEAGDTSVDPEVNRWECLKVRAGMDRSLWLSAGAHHIHQWRVKGKSLDELIELAWVGCYQNTWARFWKVVPKIERALEYEGTCRKMYGGFIGGPHKRFSPAGLKNGSLIALFLGKDKTFDESKWGGGVVALLKKLLVWVRERGDECSQKEFKDTLERYAKNLNDCCLKVELGEFRLTIFIQLMVLSGCLDQGYTVLTKAYPVKERGSWKTLNGRVGLEEEEMFDTMREVSRELGLPKDRQDFCEGLCCEANPNRERVWELLFKGQNLFMLYQPKGEDRLVPCVKFYGSTEWVPLAVKTWTEKEWGVE
jgi:hypothetical protein